MALISKNYGFHVMETIQNNIIAHNIINNYKKTLKSSNFKRKIF